MATESLRRATTMRPAMSSAGRSGLIIKWPRLRAQTSSRKAIANPSWLRARMSHKSTPPTKRPAAVAARLVVLARCTCTKPQVSICTSGQNTISSARGPDDLRRYQWRRTSAPTRRAEAATPVCTESLTAAVPSGAMGVSVRAEKLGLLVTGNVEEHFLERLAPEAPYEASRRLVGNDAAPIEHDHAASQALDLGHVVGGKQDRRAALGLISLEMGADPVGGIGI